MTSLAEAESKYGHVVQSAGGQIFGIERAASVDRQAEKLTIGTPDGFVKIDVVLNQPDIDAVLRERTAGVVKHARELRTPSPPALGAALFANSIRQKKVSGLINISSRAAVARHQQRTRKRRGLADWT